MFERGGCEVRVRPQVRFVLLAAVALVQFSGRPGWAAASGAACRPGFRIALDIGHTLARPGATSASGVTEFAYNRSLGSEVERRLRDAGVAALLIGESGAAIGLTERTAIANQAGASVFLSFHHDSVQPQYLSYWAPGGRRLAYSDVFSGFSVFVSGENVRFAESVRFAGLVGEALLGAGFTPSAHHAEDIAGERRPVVDRRRGIYRFDALAVLRTARMPAVLLEAAIIVNRRDEQVVRSSEGLARTAGAIVRSILLYCA